MTPAPAKETIKQATKPESCSWHFYFNTPRVKMSSEVPNLMEFDIFYEELPYPKPEVALRRASLRLQFKRPL